MKSKANNFTFKNLIYGFYGTLVPGLASEEKLVAIKHSGLTFDLPSYNSEISIYFWLNKCLKACNISSTVRVLESIKHIEA